MRIAFDAGVGARLPLRVGGKISPLSGDPLDLDATVKSLVPNLVQTGLSGTPTPMGDCALVEANGIEILLVTLRNQAMGTDLFTKAGCDLAAKKIVLLKSSQHFYASYSKIARHVIYADAPGSVARDLNTLPFRKVRRPLWPLKDSRAMTLIPVPPSLPGEETMMKRRFLAPLASAALMAAALFAAAPALAQVKTLKVVAHADVKILDPTFTTAYISRNFGYMVYDTLYAQDAKGVPKPQMAEKHTVSKDGLNWTFTLRPGLKFSDGSPVTAADAVASLQRWGARDSIGRAMGNAGAEWKAVDARNFTLTLKEPFGMVLEGLAKPSGFPPVILPERLAKMPTTSPLTEVLGSGPFIFKRDEWVPGNKAVFVRNPNYVARTEPPSGLAGSKKPHFDRVEWLYLPDANSADRSPEERRGRLDRAGPARLHHAAAPAIPNVKVVCRRLVAGLHRDEPVAPAIQQPQGAPGPAARGEPGEVHRRHGLPAGHARELLRDLLHLRQRRMRPLPEPSRSASPTWRAPSSCWPKVATRARRWWCWCPAT